MKKDYINLYSSPQIHFLSAEEEALLCTSMTGASEIEEYQTDNIEW